MFNATNTEVCTHLKTIIQNYPEAISNSKRIKALLMDYLPENKLLRNLLCTCIEEGIIDELRSRNSCSKADIERYERIITNSHGCSLEKAEEVVWLWIEALDVNPEAEACYNPRVLQTSIDELELSVRSYNALKRANINTVEDILNSNREDRMGVRNLGKKSIDEVLLKLQNMGLSLITDSMSEEERRKLPGHEKCETLREIRRKIAAANDIVFSPAECDHNGPCLGTCPVCDEEIRYLDQKLQEKKDKGENINLAGIAANDIKEAGCNTDSYLTEDTMEMGMPELVMGMPDSGFGDNWDSDDELDDIMKGLDI